jgi:hypothetical protein
MHRVQAREIKVAPIHYLERTRFKRQDVQHIDIAHLPSLI